MVFVYGKIVRTVQRSWRPFHPFLFLHNLGFFFKSEKGQMWKRFLYFLAECALPEPTTKKEGIVTIGLILTMVRTKYEVNVIITPGNGIRISLVDYRPDVTPTLRTNL